MTNYDELRAGFETAYIDGTVASSVAYRPQFVSNNYKEGKKVLSAIEDELLKCDQFQISVAFITMSGITPLLQTLKELEKNNVPGEILTTNYLSFSEPKALEKLNGLSNIKLRMFDVDAAGEGFHTKGYIFRKDETYRIIIGSSNITSAALTSNREWNTKLVSTKSGEMTRDIVAEFNELWNSMHSKPFDEFFELYKERYAIIKKQREIAKEEEIVSLVKYALKPNSMQTGFINNLKKIIAAGEKRALLISATGTGKTYAAAFAMRELGFKRVLFVVHRGVLAKNAKKSFENVFQKGVSTGLVGGGHYDYDKDFVFATVATLYKDEHLDHFSKDAFDCVIFDEAHHVPSDTFLKIMDYFEPKFCLGMTATPDKRDDYIEGRNVYEIFNHQIAYEIRLQQAMEESLLCPFHYFGIQDLEIIGDDKKNRNFSVLTDDERIRQIVKKASYYGHSGDRVKGLIFCSKKREAYELSDKFNRIRNPETGKYYRTIALDSKSDDDVRIDAFERLAMDEEDATPEYQPIDYIFSVDILNEGVDIVEVNQVIMLRPTQSPIVFIQQLGRGLRKADGKEYVVILDFIGNYKNNFMIPIALSGDRTYNKDNIRRYLMEGGRVIPGASTIHFDEISRKKIYDSIDRMSTTKNMLKDKYYTLKDRLGKIPSILDFYENGEIDPMLFVEYSGSYDQFVRLVDKEYKISFSDKEERTLEFISNNIMNGKRIHELIMLKLLLDNGEFTSSEFKDVLAKFGEKYRESDYLSAYGVITKSFMNTDTEKKKYSNVDLVKASETAEGQLRRVVALYEKASNILFVNEVRQLIEYGIRRYNDMYKNHDDNNLVLYQKYSRKDVCRILNWEKDNSSTVYGYRIKHGTCPIFVTYNKADNIAETTKYKDEFEPISLNPKEFSNKLFSWMTRSKVKITSREAQQIIKAKESGLKILLFMKKSDGEGSDFYYMGEVDPVDFEQTTILDKNKKAIPIVNFKLELRNEARKDIFDYFTA